MKLLFVLSGRSFFGAEIVTLNLMKQLASEGADVHCLAHERADERFLSELRSSGIAFTQFDLGWIFISEPVWTLEGIKAWPGAQKIYRRLCSSFQPDAIVHAAYHTLVMLPRAAVPTIFYAHDAFEHSKKHRLIFWLIRKKLRGAIAVSAFGKRALEPLLRGVTVDVVPNGVPESLPVSGPKRPEFTVGIVGQIVPRKGHEVLFRAVAHLRASGHLVRCLVVGSGPPDVHARLLALVADLGIHDCVEWRGFSSDHDSLYAEIDVLAAPSVSPEPFGLTPIEAGMRGVPSVASAAGGFLETIVDDRTGMLFARGDSAELAMKLEQLMNDRTRLQLMGQAAREHVIRHFSARAMAYNFVASIEGFLDTH